MNNERTTNLTKQGKVKISVNFLKKYHKKSTNPDIKNLLKALIKQLEGVKIKDKFYFTTSPTSYELLKQEIPEKYLVDIKKMGHRYSDSSWIAVEETIVYTNCDEQTASY